MAWKLQDIIFPLFGSYEKLVDSNKDASDKGILERYNESIAVDFDTNLFPLIDKVRENVRDIQTLFSRYVAFFEDMLGITVFLSSDIEFRRRLARYAHRYYEIKGTRRGFEVLASLIGMTVVITEDFTYFSFDSPVLFDDPVRTFDIGKCGSYCTSYTADFTGVGVLTPEMESAIKNIVKFNEPINAVLTGLTYNGNSIPL